MEQRSSSKIFRSKAEEVAYDTNRHCGSHTRQW